MRWSASIAQTTFMSHTQTNIACPEEVIYLSNSFPSPTEPYVGAEIEELRHRGVRVTPCSVWPPDAPPNPEESTTHPVLTVFPRGPWPWLGALALCIQQAFGLRDILWRLVWNGNESWNLRTRGLAHTVLGARLVLLLSGTNVRHIHIHHGHLAAWVGLIAARLLRVPYTLTLHGSDLLLQAAFLDAKLQHCAACFTISEFNREFLLQRYPQIAPGKVRVQRMGVHIPVAEFGDARNEHSNRLFTLLAVGRLHAVKDHSFLVRACAVLKASGERVLCRIAGEGPERRQIEKLIRNMGLTEDVVLLGHIPQKNLTAYYRDADLVVLTSQSEGIPLTLMEAMAFGRPVLAPSITGIPELVLDGKTGFLYTQGSISDFADRVMLLRRTYSALGPVREAAYEHVRTFFNREINLHQFSELFVNRILKAEESANADSLLQQVQL